MLEYLQVSAHPATYSCITHCQHTSLPHTCLSDAHNGRHAYCSFHHIKRTRTRRRCIDRSAGEASVLLTRCTVLHHLLAPSLEVSPCLIYSTPNESQYSSIQHILLSKPSAQNEELLCTPKVGLLYPTYEQMFGILLS